MALSLAFLRRVMITAAAVLGGVACQSGPSAPSVSPTAPTNLAPEWWSTGATGLQPAVDLSVCLSAPSPACFAAPRTQAAAVGAEPVTGPPINLSGTVNNTTVTLAWTPPGFQDAPVISYLIDVGSTPNFPSPDLVSIDTFSASTTLQASGVAPGTYYVRVRARNALGISAPSNEIQVVVGVIIVPGPGCPGPPRSLTGGGSIGTVTLSWQPPISGTVQSYIIEVGAAPGATNIGTLNNGLSTTFIRAGVPAGVYYIRIRAVGPGCAPSAPSNELAVTVAGAVPPGGPSVTLTLVYTCSRCTGDPDNYALNVDCVNGRCQIHRTPNATRSGTVTATVRGTGVHNVEVVARSASWSLTMSGGMTPGSWRILYPPGGAGLSVGSCRITSSIPEMFTEFMVGGGGGC
jgi:fibronectin type III domain protein